MAHLDIGWEVGDLSEFLAILNSFFLPKAWVDVSVMLLKAPSLCLAGVYMGGVSACALGRWEDGEGWLLIKKKEKNKQKNLVVYLNISCLSADTWFGIKGVSGSLVKRDTSPNIWPLPLEE